MILQVNMVIVGAHAVMANGGVIALVGLNMVALAAQRHAIPFVVLAGSHKIKELGKVHQFVQKIQNASNTTVEDTYKLPLAISNICPQLISSEIQLVFLDAKVGPPYEKGLAKDVLFVVGYIVIIDSFTSARAGLFRMKGADIVGLYHPLINEKLVIFLHGYEHDLMHM